MSSHKALRGCVAPLVIVVMSVVMPGIVRADDTVDALSKDPQRLRQVLHDCRQKQDAANDPLCIAASKAWRVRFFGPAKATTLHGHDQSESANSAHDTGEGQHVAPSSTTP